MKKILITGGAGFIGSNLALKLIERGDDVTVLDNLSPQVHGEAPETTSPLYGSIKEKVRFIHGSVARRADWRKALRNQEAVIHLAAETGTGQSMYEIKRYTDVNIGGTALMLDVLTNERHTIQKIIVASSRAIYGEGKYVCENHKIVFPAPREDKDMASGFFDCRCPECGTPVDLLPTTEDSKIHPSSIYGITKQTQENMVLTTGRAIGIPSIAFRYQNVYGPGQSLANPYTGILSIFSNLIKTRSSINIFEDGKESRDFVYIDDVVDATIKGIDSNEGEYQAFNVGSGVATSVLNVADMLCKNIGVEVDLAITGNYRIGDIRHNAADLTKIKVFFEYEPKWTLAEGIKIFCAWVSNQSSFNTNYASAINEMKLKKLLIAPVTECMKKSTPLIVTNMK